MEKIAIYSLDEVYTKRNPETGKWFVYGQKAKDGSNCVPYICNNFATAKKMMLTIHHYNRTGEKKAFANSSNYFFKKQKWPKHLTFVPS